MLNTNSSCRRIWVALTAVYVLLSPCNVRAQDAKAVTDLRKAAAARIPRASLLEQATTSADPFSSNEASAVIARPSFSDLLDSAVDFNNKEGTLSLRVTPALLVTDYPDWYLTGLAVTAAANTDEKNFSIGGKWDFNFRDPRFYYGLHYKSVEAEIRQRADTECAGETGPALVRCRSQRFEDVLKAHRQAMSNNPIALSLGGNATYDNEGHFGGGNATLAFDAKLKLNEPADDGANDDLDDSGSPRFPMKLVATANVKYEDAPPSDEEKDQLEKAGVTPGDNDRGQKAGGGLELGFNVGLGGKNGNERSLELGVGAAALACLDGLCEKLDNGSSVKLNPYLAVAVTKSIGGRIDVVWDGTGHTLGDAFAGASLKYSFRKPPDAPESSQN